MVEKRLKKKVESQGNITTKLTKAETEVLHYLTNEYLTIRRVAIRRQTSVSAVYKTLKRLKEKGVINQHFEKVEKKRSTLGAKLHKIRLHAEEYNIKIIYKDKRYKKRLEKNSTITIDGNTIRLYRNSIEVYSGQSFYGDKPQIAERIAVKYWNTFFNRLEDRFKIIIIKDGYENITRVNAHYAETNNELAEECNRNADKIRLYAEEDGKLWFTIDNSFNMNEAETMHPKTAKRDMEDVIQPFFKDLRNNPVTMGQVLKIIQEQAIHNRDTAAGLKAIVELIKGPDPIKEDKKQRKIPEYIG